MYVLFVHLFVRTRECVSSNQVGVEPVKWNEVKGMDHVTAV